MSFVTNLLLSHFILFWLILSTIGFSYLISGFTYTLGIAHLQCCFCRIGTEHEKFGFEIGTLRPMKYEQIAGLLHGIAERFDWDRIMEGDNIIGLQQVKWSSWLSLFPFHS